MNSRQRLTAILAGAALCSGGAVAYAASGTSVPSTGSVVFYYGKSGGNNNGYDVTGKASLRQCLDAPASTARTQFVSELRQNKSLAPDTTIQTASAYYSDPAKTTGYVSTGSSNKYYPMVTWNYSSAMGANATGYGKTAC